MSWLDRCVAECAQSHAMHGDDAGARAITCAALYGEAWAISFFPGHADAIRKAFAYAAQEVARQPNPWVDYDRAYAQQVAA